jgi:hypothetical protein
MQTSQSIAALAKALAAFQGEATNPPKTRTAKVPTKSGGEYKYNYADLSDIITAVKAGMKKHGLSVVQSAVSDGQGIGVTTLLTHDSGEWIKSDPLILPLQAATPQAAGSAVTYARRYALSAILGISTEEDDDAGIAQDHQSNRPAPAPRPNATAPQTHTPQTYQQPQAGNKPTIRNPDEPCTEPQQRRLFALAKQAALDVEALGNYVKTTYKVTSSKDLTKGQISELMDAIEDGSVGEALTAPGFNWADEVAEGGDAA